MLEIFRIDQIPHLLNERNLSESSDSYASDHLEHLPRQSLPFQSHVLVLFVVKQLKELLLHLVAHFDLGHFSLQLKFRLEDFGY